MNIEKFRKVYDRLLRPYIRGWKVEQETFEVQGGGALGTARIVLRGPDGRRVTAGQNLWYTDDGPKEATLWHLLNLSWKIRFEDISEPRDGRAAVQLRLRGIQEDRRFLESIGIRGFLNRHWNHLYTWNEAIARLEGHLDGDQLQQTKSIDN